jgi:hypothetical protein
MTLTQHEGGNANSKEETGHLLTAILPTSAAPKRLCRTTEQYLSQYKNKIFPAIARKSTMDTVKEHP